MLPVKFLNSDKQPTAAILTLVLALALPPQKAKSMAKVLLKLGATASQADLNGCTAFHRYVAQADLSIVESLTELDKTGVKAALNHLVIGSRYWNPQALSVLHTAIGREDTTLVLRLLEAGVNPQIDFDAWLKAAKFSTTLEKRLSSYEENMKLYESSVEQPLITAIKTCREPEVLYRLLERGADPNSMTTASRQVLRDEWSRRYNKGETALDLVREQIKQLEKYTKEKPAASKPSALLPNMDEYLRGFQPGTYQHTVIANDITSKRKGYEDAMKEYEKAMKKDEKQEGLAEKQEAVKEALAAMKKVEGFMVKKGAKTFKELYPDITSGSQAYNSSSTSTKEETKKEPYKYTLTFLNTTDVTDARKKAYTDL